MTMSMLFSSTSFKNNITEMKFMLVHQRVLPLFQHAAREGISLDLEEVFHRYTFANVSLFFLGFDLGSLALDLPPIPFTKACSSTYTQLLRLLLLLFHLFIPLILFSLLILMQF
jgi:hypothetical protein